MHDAFLCRELTKRIYNWVVQTCVDVANDVSDLVLRERLVDAAYEYGRCSFGVSLGYLTTEHGQRCASGKMLTFTFDGVEFTLTMAQH